MSDARFEDGDEKALRLGAETPEDLEVISTLAQDAVAQTSDMSWAAKQRRFALLLNRFRWEDKNRAESSGRAYERVQSLLVIDGALRVQTSGVTPDDKDLALALLSVAFEAGEDGAGHVVLTFSGDGQIRVGVECLDVRLSDVSRPYIARASRAPDHGDS
ncbi:MAG: DUF2948 family protein [Pseudomonadota bacterium]